MSRKNKYMNASSTRNLVKKYATLTALFSLATVTTGMVGIASLTHPMDPYGAAALSGSAMFLFGACASNSQRSFYSKKLKRRHPSYNGNQIRKL